MTATSDGNSYNRTELVWAGKRTQVDRVALPFQRVETINAPRGGDMFSSLKEDGGWRNKLIWVTTSSCWPRCCAATRMPASNHLLGRATFSIFTHIERRRLPRSFSFHPRDTLPPPRPRA